MTKRYQLGFPKGISCLWLDANRGCHAVVDLKGAFACGQAVAVCLEKEHAEKIVEALNFYEEQQTIFKQ